MAPFKIIFSIFALDKSNKKMSNYKDKEILSASIAGEFDICDIGLSERVPFEIELEDDSWDDSYELNIYNSDKKNTKISTLNVGIIDSKMSFSIEPKTDGIESRGNYYFEIFNTVTSRIEFKGELKIIE